MWFWKTIFPFAVFRCSMSDSDSDSPPPLEPIPAAVAPPLPVGPVAAHIVAFVVAEVDHLVAQGVAAPLAFFAVQEYWHVPLPFGWAPFFLPDHPFAPGWEPEVEVEV